MYAVSRNFKKKCKDNIRDYKEFTITNLTDNETYGTDEIIDVEIEGIAYSDYQIIGRSVAKEITIKFANQLHDLENKEISVETSIDGEVLPFGNFIIDRQSFSDTDNTSSARGYDYMIKFDIAYNGDNLTYPCTLQDVLDDLCTQVGVENASIGIVNSELKVTGNNFTDGETCREVLSQIAQCSGTFATIGRDNKLYLRNLEKDTKAKSNSVLQMKLQGAFSDYNEGGIIHKANKETLTPTQYLEDFTRKRDYGPVNKVVIELSDEIEGEEEIRQDSESIARDGIQTITIKDNLFLMTNEARVYAIDNLWGVLHNIIYMPFSCSYLGFPYLDMGDLIQVTDINGTTKVSYVFNYTLTMNGGYMGTLETPTITKTQEQYPQENTLNQRFKQVGISVDKANGEIQSLIETTDGMQSSITQNAEQIELRVAKDDVISSINQSAEQIEIDANRISLNGKTIALTGDDITIESTNFNVDTEGNATMRSANITGGNIEMLDSNQDKVVTLNGDGIKFYTNGEPIGSVMGVRHEPTDDRGLFLTGADGSSAIGIAHRNMDTGYIDIDFGYFDGGTFSKDNDGLYIGNDIRFESNLYGIQDNMSRIKFWVTANSTTSAFVFRNIQDDNNIAVFQEGSDGQAVSLRGDTINLYGDVYVNGRPIATTSCDGRLKHNIQDTQIEALPQIEQIEHREFNWNENDKKVSIGYIAQELEKINDELIVKTPQYDEDGKQIDNLYSIDLLNMVALSTKAIQELNEKVKQQDEIIKEMAKKLDIKIKDNKKKLKSTNKVDYGKDIKYTREKEIISEKYKTIVKDGKLEKIKVEDKKIRITSQGKKIEEKKYE